MRRGAKPLAQLFRCPTCRYAPSAANAEEITPYLPDESSANGGFPVWCRGPDALHLLRTHGRRHCASDTVIRSPGQLRKVEQNPTV